MSASNLVANLQAAADAYCAATGLSRSRLATIIFNDGKKLDLIAGGADLNTRSFEKAMRWFSANWPDGVAWPEGIARPAPESELPAAQQEGAAA